MTLDWDGKIRMDCSSPSAMASLIERKDAFDIPTGNDADADRHGIVTPDAGLMNPNHYLAVAIQYLYGGARPGWRPDTAIGKTLVSSSMIDRVAADLGRTAARGAGRVQVVRARAARRVGRLRRRGVGRRVLPAVRRHRLDRPTRTASCSPCSRRRSSRDGQDARASTTPSSPSGTVRPPTRASMPRPTASRRRAAGPLPRRRRREPLAGEPITAKLTEAPGNGAKIGGLKVTTESAWFAARPSGTEDVYKIYAESFRGAGAPRPGAGRGQGGRQRRAGG